MHICTGTVDDGVCSQKQELMFRMHVVAAAGIQVLKWVLLVHVHVHVVGAAHMQEYSTYCSEFCQFTGCM